MVRIFVAAVLVPGNFQPFLIVVVVVIAVVFVILIVKPTPKDATDGTDAGHSAAVAHALLQQLVANLPAEYARVILLVLFDSLLNLGSRDTRFRTSDHSRSYATRLLVALKDFADTSMRHPQLATDHTGTDTLCGQLNDFEPNMIWERSSVDKHPSQLIDSSLACKWKKKGKFLIFGLLFR